ncbi:MAG: hypothetical protein IT176_10405 [Acidobacteria bacterium]|nr:hypothetical protein [Acidobacteriota bacterium]
MPHRTLVAVPAALCAVLVAAVAVSSATRTFYEDDPLLREPETQDASGVQERAIDLMFDLSLNLFARPGDPAENVRAQNINTIDELPDSNWFTNRILSRPVSPEEAARGPLTGSGPAPGPWTVIRDKRAGFAPGFTMRDSEGGIWFVSFDARGYPEAATGAVLVANKIFWTLGYWQVENHLAAVRPENIVVDASATIRPPSGVRRQMTRGDVEDVLERAHRSADGSYRAIASRAVPGRPVDGFFYHGTRSDDPNDLVHHEHRRELRALKVFGAWTNLVDMKAGNTLDSVIVENGRSVVRHYLQDVGSTFGSGANGLREFDEGWEYLFEGRPALRRLASFGFALSRWQTLDYERHDSIGRFEGDAFDPMAWKPRVPTAAFLRARPDDTFWAARRVMAFSDEMIRAVVATGQYSDPAAARHLGDVLIKRRDAIGRAYLPAINPIIDPALDGAGVVTFRNAAVDAGVEAAPAGYTAAWFAFDNATGESRPLTTTSGPTTRLAAPSSLSGVQTGFVRVDLGATGAPRSSWERPVQAYFRRETGGWRLVGFERLPDP